MARGTVMNQLSNMTSNPYPRPKEQQSINTFCELCERTIRTLDWSAHKNSKKHRQAEAVERGEVQGSNGHHDGNINGFGGDVSTTTCTDGANEFGSGDSFTNGGASGTNGWGTGNDVGWGADNDAGWGSAGGFNAASNYSSNAFSNGGGGRVCYGCGQTGHQKRDCPSGGSGGGMACYGCGETGHQKRDCPQGSSGQTCFNCGGIGHRKADCDQPHKPMGGGRSCFNCGGSGHMKSECTEPRVMRCRNCEQEGHTSRECGLPTDWSKVKCRNCNGFGHGAARCPEPPAVASDGDWGNGGGSGAGAVGGWDAAPTEPTGHWADDTTSATETSGW